MAPTEQQLRQGFRLGDCLVQPRQSRIVRSDGAVHLEPRVMDVLVALARSHFDLEGCVPSDEHLCLLDGRFEVLVHWRDPFNGGQGIGHAVPFDFSDDSGTFWFFDAANVELVVKVLDAGTPAATTAEGLWRPRRRGSPLSWEGGACGLGEGGQGG